MFIDDNIFEKMTKNIDMKIYRLGNIDIKISFLNSVYRTNLTTIVKILEFRMYYFPAYEDKTFLAQ